MLMRSSFAVMFLVALFATSAAPGRPYLHAPSVDKTYAKHDPSGTTILSNGRYLTPAGRHFPVARMPYGLALSRDGKTLFVASEGAGHLVTDWRGPRPTFTDVNPPSLKNKKRGDQESNTGGAEFSPDGRTLYWGGGESGAILVIDVASPASITQIPLNVPVAGREFKDSYVIDLKVSADGKHIYCADVTNFRVVVVDAALRQVVGSVAVGRYPYALAVAGNSVYVANIGLFEYSKIPPPTLPGFDPRGLTFPAFGYPSPDAELGVDFEGRRVPGLGEPNVADSFSVWGIDVSAPTRPVVTSRLKTGLLVGAPSDNGKTVGGSAPNYLVPHGDALFVSNGNNDVIERVNLSRQSIAVSKKVSPSPLVARVRGVSPAGMTVSPDGARLYVAALGLNSIAVLNAQTLEPIGYIPTAWYPYRVALSPDGRSLACICFRGFGNGPNGGKDKPKSPFLGMKGVLSVIDVPSDRELKTMTDTVLANNGIVDRQADLPWMSSPVIPTTPGIASREIKYVVFIAKENHTYDAIFDRIPGAKHDPDLLRWGLKQTVSAPGQPTLNNVAIMTNHNALARQFSVSDNFYMEPEASGVGHRWLVGVQPNNLMQMTYSVGWKFIRDSTAPGRLYSMGSNGSLMPEDYPEAGSMWEHLYRNGVSFRNYGEGFELSGVEEGENQSPTGARETINAPMPKALFDNTCREFPIFNMHIPDQFRADVLKSDIEAHVQKAGKPFPQFINIALCMDHGDDLRPAKGYPYMASYMADNDLALGRIVEYLSHTPYWKNMAIFVTQDDSGGEPDHVDAQRSVLLVISPWARRGYVAHRHTTIVSMHRTLYQIFGLPPLNMFDALVNDFSDCFTTKPDYRPYTCVPVDPRIFSPARAKDPKDPQYKNTWKVPRIPMDDPDDMERILKAAERELMRK